MEVRIYPNASRPGVGMKPRRESSRPLLPQHSRHCPVLEAGNAAGFLVYPALEPTESYHIEYQGEGKYSFAFMVSATPGGKWEGLFSVQITMPVGTLGMIKEEVAFTSRKPTMSREQALAIMRTFIVPEDLGTPPGAISLRGATNFQTPPGWDTVYTPVFNLIDRPIAPMLVIRVETDWFAHDTEFRYVLEPGEGIPGTHNLPLGQVMFVPREEVTMRDATPEETESFQKSKKEFYEEKSKHKVSTPLGVQHSPHYLRQSSKSQKP